MPVAYECKQPITLATAETLANLVRYTAFKTGPLSSNVAEAGGFVRTATACTTPDVQYHFAPGYFVEHGFQKIKEHAYTFKPTLVRRFSLTSEPMIQTYSPVPRQNPAAHIWNQLCSAKISSCRKVRKH